MREFGAFIRVHATGVGTPRSESTVTTWNGKATSP